MTTPFRALAYSLCLAAALPRAARAQTALDSLIAADHAQSDAGFAAMIGHAATDLVLVYPGAPVIANRDAAVSLIEAQVALRRINARWVPLHGEVSADGNFGITYGVTAI